MSDTSKEINEEKSKKPITTTPPVKDVKDVKDVQYVQYVQNKSLWTQWTVDSDFFKRHFSNSTIDLIISNLLQNQRVFTIGELVEITGKTKQTIYKTISRYSPYFVQNKPDGKIVHIQLSTIIIKEIEEKINNLEQQKIKKEQEELRRQAEKEKDEGLKESIFTHIRLHKPKREGNLVFFDFNELMLDDPTLADFFTNNSTKFLEIYSDYFDGEVDVRLLNLPKSSVLNIEEIRKEHLEKILCIEGRVTSFGEVKPVITKVRYDCPSCGAILSVEQNYRLGELKEPTRCSCGRRGGFKILERDEVDACFIQLEDLQEKTDNPHSQRIKAVLFNELTKKESIKIFNPGNEVRVIGLLKEVPIFKRNKQTIFLNWILEVNSAELIEKEIEIINLSEEDKTQFTELSTDIDINGISSLMDSFAPEVYGYDEIKKAIILQLCNSRNNKKENKIRNKSNILLIGDPGVAKSVLCDFVLEITPGSRKAVGGGSSAVGITASVMKEEDALGGYRVEPGALILAKDLLVLDELNNLHDEDKPKLQEGMSEQTVSINKANIHVQMKVTCGMIAIANPKNGHFSEEDSNLSSQFNIPSPILNRFDSVFVVRDKQNEEIDKHIGSRMIKRHKGTLNPKYNKEFLKKFFVYVKNLPTPKLNDEIDKEFQETYARCRRIKNPGVRINPRFLESLIRMSISSAKLRQAEFVESKDINTALSILAKSQYNIYQDWIVGGKK